MRNLEKTSFILLYNLYHLLLAISPALKNELNLEKLGKQRVREDFNVLRKHRFINEICSFGLVCEESGLELEESGSAGAVYLGKEEVGRRLVCAYELYDICEI